MKLFDQRTIKRFALLPTLLDDRNTVWLKWYNVMQQFCYNTYGMGHPRLSKNKWIDFKTYK